MKYFATYSDKSSEYLPFLVNSVSVAASNLDSIEEVSMI
jgi:hypothetical protein